MVLKIKLGNAVRNAADKSAQSRASDGFLAPGEELVLSSSPYASMDAITMRGFALPETDGIWSSAAVSTIDVRLREVDAGRRYRVVIGAISFEVGAHRALVAMRINGGPAHQVLANTSGWSSIVADWEVQVVGKIPMVRIEFHVANPMSPTALGYGDDNRLLGFKVRSLQLLDLGPANVGVPPVAPLPEAAVAVTEVQEVTSGRGGGVFTQSPVETVHALAKRGPFLRMVLLDKNPVVRLVRWMRRVSRNMEEMRRQLDLIRIDSARQARELGERVDSIEVDARVQEREHRRTGSSVDAIIERLELNHARLLSIEESTQEAGRLQQQRRDEHADSLESIIANTDGLGRNVATVLDTLNATLSESMRMLREFESVDTRLAGMDRALRLVQKQGEEHAQHAIAGIRELREQLHLSLEQQQVRSEQAQVGIESSLQGMIERQWSESDDLRKHMHSTLQQLESRHQLEREELKRQVQGVLGECARALDVRSDVDAEVLRHHVLRLHEKLDRLSASWSVVSLPGVAVDEAASGQALQLIAQLHDKLDNNEIEIGQVLELLIGIKERVDTHQLVLSGVVDRLSAPAQRRVLRRHDGWLLAVGFGTFSCSESDDLLAMCLLENGDVERGLRLFLERALKPGDVFIDAGANIGLHTVAAANVVGPTGKVFAVEAMPRTLQHLRASLRLSNVEDRVEVLPVALGSCDEDGRQFHVGAVAGHSSLYPIAGELEVLRVDVRTLDSLLGGARVALVKIDVEGAELDVLKGMRTLLAANPDMGIVAEYAVSHLSRAGTSEVEWESFRAEHGFALYRIDDLTGTCLPVERFAALREHVSSNVLMCAVDSSLPFEIGMEVTQ